MANEEHLKILNQGVEVWNRWREEDLDVLWPDLSGADLGRADLHEANLIRANLSEAGLYMADLSGADLTRATLSRANLSRADIRETNFSWADLTGANLSLASAGDTMFASLDMSEAKGLDIVQHNYPSHITIDTIYRSHGQIPDAFLRGCGVPETFIAYMGSLTGKAFEYYSCFISYSHKDEAFAQRLHADLQAKGVRCWFAPEDMKIGDKIRPRIDESIRIHDKLLLILSEHSVASQWVEHEVEHALDLEGERQAPVLFPIRLDEAVLDSQIGWAGAVRRGRHIGDFRAWKDHDAYQRAFDRLLRDLKASEDESTESPKH